MKPKIFSATKIRTGEVRASYAHLFEPHGFDGSEPRYSVRLLIPKSDTETAEAVKNAIQAAYEEGVKGDWKGARPQMANPVLYDGDGVNRDGLPWPEENKGCWFVNAKSTRRPGVVRTDGSILTEDTEFYSGCYCLATLAFRPFNKNGNKGVSCYVNSVMMTRPGESLGGGSTPEEDFADIIGGGNMYSDDDL